MGTSQLSRWPLGLSLVVIWIPWVALSIFLGIYCPWALADQRPEDLIARTWPWTLAWGFWTLALLFCVLYFSNPFLYEKRDNSLVGAEPSSDYAQGRRTLIHAIFCGLICALPAVAISFLGLMVSVPNYLEGLKEKGNVVSLPDSAGKVGNGPGVQELPQAYWFVIDVSRSALDSSLDPRHNRICDLVTTLFSRDGGGGLSGPLIHDGAAVKAIYFAGGTAEAETYTPGQGRTVRDFGAQACRRLDDILQSPSAHPSLDRDHSDIVTELGAIAADAQAQQRQYSHLTVIFLSDFFHDARQMQPREVESEVQRFASRLPFLEAVHFVGIVIPQNSARGERSVERSSEIDIRRYLEKYSSGARNDVGSFSMTPLDEVASNETSERGALAAFAAYRRAPLPKSLYLKYRKTPPAGIVSSVRIPGDSRFDHLLLGLQQVRETEPGSLILDFGAGNPATKDFTLALGSQQRLPWWSYDAKTGAEKELFVRMRRPAILPNEEEVELLVAVPEDETTYVIHLAVFPTIGTIAYSALCWAITFAVLTMIGLSIEGSGLLRFIGLISRRSRANPVGVEPAASPGS